MLANLLSALMPRALTQPLWLHVLARAEGPASPSRGRLTHPAAHVALGGLRRLWRRPGHCCSLTRGGWAGAATLQPTKVLSASRRAPLALRLQPRSRPRQPPPPAQAYFLPKARGHPARAGFPLPPRAARPVAREPHGRKPLKRPWKVALAAAQAHSLPGACVQGPPRGPRLR